MARILIIDDEDTVRTAIRQIVEWAGHEAIEASNGDDAIVLQRDAPADLIISDIFMPGKRGIDTIVELRRAHPQVPIIAISGGRMDGAADYLPIARKLGVSHVMDKPFEMIALLNAVRDCLDDGTPP